MSSIVGALLDVSDSMKNSIGDGFEEDGRTWAHSIFTVANDIAQHDITESNLFFVAGFGAKYCRDAFDIITTVISEDDKANEIPLSEQNVCATFATIENIFTILEHNGAHTIRRWVKHEKVQYLVTEYVARMLLIKLQTDTSFTEKFVKKYLPLACRNLDDIPGAKFLQSAFASIKPSTEQASEEDINDIIAKSFLKSLTKGSLYNAKEISNILQGSMNDKGLQSDKVKELLHRVENFIYGSTPLYSALSVTAAFFNNIRSIYEKHHKLLFILSDGKPTDKGDLSSIQLNFEREKVTIVSCYISKSSKVVSKKLHSVPEFNWDEGAKFLFELSSFIPTSSITRAIFIKNKWEIDITNNETRLFMHVNHPDNLKDACNLARNAVCCQDSLSELLVSVALDLYINDKNRSIKVYDQGNDGTCYAHASATVMHIVMLRILGRKRRISTFRYLRDEMIRRHGIQGANTLQVLRGICSEYRLRCREVDVHGAMKAITEKRPVVVKFHLTEQNWNKFNDFFHSKPFGILTKHDFKINLMGRRRGHAVVLTSFNSRYLQLMNSWGDSWADNGFFKVENADVLKMEFIDVYCDERDLSVDENIHYKMYGAKLADELLGSLTALQKAEFTCPKCKRASKVNDYSGTLTHACCPRCERQFSSHDGKGNLLALNIYLTSLSR